MTTEQQYIASLDIEASYNLAKQMEAYRTNSVLGDRRAQRQSLRPGRC